MCYGEAFNPGLCRQRQQAGIAWRFSIHQRDVGPEVLLKAMREGTAGISGFRYFHDHDPRVFDLVVDDPTVAKIILTRNPLESFISWKIARESNQWRTTSAANIKTARPKFVVEEFRARVEVLEEFQRDLVNRLQVSGQTAFYIDYDDVLDLKVINGLAAFLEVEGRLEKLDLSLQEAEHWRPIVRKGFKPCRK